MIKLTFCLARLPHLSREGFQAYWFDTHGPLVRSVQQVLRIRRYVQLHSAAETLSEPLRQQRGGPAGYDGVAELWWDSWDDLAANAADPAARRRGRCCWRTSVGSSTSRDHRCGGVRSGR
jgi:hypothetical protein